MNLKDAFRSSDNFMNSFHEIIKSFSDLPPDASDTLNAAASILDDFFNSPFGEIYFDSRKPLDSAEPHLYYLIVESSSYKIQNEILSELIKAGLIGTYFSINRDTGNNNCEMIYLPSDKSEEHNCKISEEFFHQLALKFPDVIFSLQDCKNLSFNFIVQSRYHRDSYKESLYVYDNYYGHELLIAESEEVPFDINLCGSLFRAKLPLFTDLDALGAWLPFLEGEIQKPYFRNLMDKVSSAYNKEDPRIFPHKDDIFSAFQITRPDTVKVVILGQDPYHGAGQANGLAFSVNRSVKFPPSLRNIFNELVDDIGCKYPESGDLSPWAEQGVLLLNTSLTVEEGKPNSHSDWGWHDFTKAVFRAVLALPQPVVFLLWGRNAQEFVADLDIDLYTNKKFLTSTHPSPFSARRACGSVPAFLGSKPFSNANKLLLEMGVTGITWEL